MSEAYKIDSLSARCMEEEDTLAELRFVLRNELSRAGLEDVVVPPQLQSCRLATDPYDGSVSLVGEWRSGRGARIGSVVIHANGQLHAELYVTKPLPRDAARFVDAVEAFGAAGALRAELRIVPELG
ncbi:MAG TPA: hypothetical protein VFN67_03500 [Polyangiales bacterium]|nr:hypothetical protein [Polyangiales bacterium]